MFFKLRENGLNGSFHEMDIWGAKNGIAAKPSHWKLYFLKLLANELYNLPEKWFIPVNYLY